MAMAQAKEIEVALQPLPQEPPKPEVKPKPQPPPKPMMRQAPEPKPKAPPSPPQVARDKRIMRMAMQPARHTVLPATPAALMPLPKPAVKDNAPVSEVKPSAIEDEPVATGLPQGKKNAGAPKLIRLAKADPVPGGG